MRGVKFVVALFVAVAIGAVAWAAPVSVSIVPAVDKAQVTPSEGARLHFGITNTTDRDLAILRYTTPLGGFESNLFAVTRDGQPVPYIGRMVLRLAPTAEDWITLSPGESIEAMVDLSEAYDLRRGGTYAITFRHPIGVRELDATLEQMAPNGSSLAPQLEFVESNTIEVFVDGPDTVPEEAPLPEFGYSGCTSSQQSSLSSARSSGRSLAAKSYNQLAGTSGSSNSLYKTWFGTYTSSRYSTVKNGYYNIYYAFGRTWNYTCTSCQSGVIAYVYPNRTYYVWICPGFFNYNSKTRGSFLLHEASHWTAILGTDDYTYGYSNCLNLAKTNPSAAVYNADNYRYFSLYVP